MSKILIISSEYTGHGHNSITESLKEQISLIYPDTIFEVIDGFSLGGSVSYTMGKLYNPVAVNLPFLWKLSYQFVNIFPALMVFMTTLNIQKNFIKTIKKMQPDLIVPIHPAFVRPVLNVLQKENISVPVIPLIADLDNVSSLWADERCKYIVCPTNEAAESMCDLGVSRDILKVMGFPIRAKFCPQMLELPEDMGFQNGKKIRILLMSGSQGNKQVYKMSRVLLEKLNCQVTIMAGNNKALKNFLNKTLKPIYKDDIEICGFTSDVDFYMKNSDLLIVRASPNVLMESVNLCKPVIVTGSLMGQEEKNPQFVVNHNLGVFCKEINKLPEVIQKLIHNNGKGLKEIVSSQLDFREPHSAKKITELLVESAEQQNRVQQNEKGA